MSIAVFLLVLAAVLILLAAVKCPEPPRVSFAWLGVFLIVVVQILGFK